MDNRINLSSLNITNHEELKIIPLQIGIGIYANFELLTKEMDSILKEVENRLPNLSWNFLLYPNEFHMRELVLKNTPHILIVSEYWGHSGYKRINRYVDDLLAPLINIRKSVGLAKSPLIVLIAENKISTLYKGYIEGVHYDFVIPPFDKSILNIEELVSLVNRMSEYLLKLIHKHNL